MVVMSAMVGRRRPIGQRLGGFIPIRRMRPLGPMDDDWTSRITDTGACMASCSRDRDPVGGRDPALPAALALPDDVADGSPAARRTRGVIVIHELLGLNDDIRRIAARFADAGYVTVAPDFLAGLGPKPLCIARFARGIGRVRVGRPYRQLAAAEAWLRGRTGGRRCPDRRRRLLHGRRLRPPLRRRRDR